MTKAQGQACIVIMKKDMHTQRLFRLNVCNTERHVDALATECRYHEVSLRLQVPAGALQSKALSVFENM